jgi:hypothetical protein
MSDDNNSQDDQTAPKVNEPVETTLSTDRREALKKLGRYGLYTAPALLALFETEKAVAATT